MHVTWFIFSHFIFISSKCKIVFDWPTYTTISSIQAKATHDSSLGSARRRFQIVNDIFYQEKARKLKVVRTCSKGCALEFVGRPLICCWGLRGRRARRGWSWCRVADQSCRICAHRSPYWTRKVSACGRARWFSEKRNGKIEELLWNQSFRVFWFLRRKV